MGYVALYRKYRPTLFKDIVGQENVTAILRNQVKNNKVSHAYIFSGTRGTGKTSAAKVFARAINCENPKDGEPCNECSSCLSILNGDTTDVVEMDAASNNSVDNVREIRNEVMYASTTVKYRVYIIDEVHMLTTSAFNALLKTLEEPPENVVFILATTEQHKIPVTILSRCIRFDFSKITEEDIASRVKFVLQEENVEYEEEAVNFIAKLADGALRDALSILDRCLSENSEKLELKKVEEIIGTVDKEATSKITKYILEADSVDAIDELDKIITKGKDLRQFIYELTENFLNLLTNSEEYLNQKSKIINIIDELSKLDTSIRLSSKPNIVVKAAIVRICNIGSSVMVSENTSTNVANSSDIQTNNSNVNNVDLTAVNSNIERLNSKIKNIENKIIEFNTMGIKNNIANSEVKKADVSASINEVEVIGNKKIDDDFEVEGAKLEVWKEFEKFKVYLTDIGKIRLFSYINYCSMYTDGENIYIITTNEFAYKFLIEEENRNEVATALASQFNVNIPVKINLKKK